MFNTLLRPLKLPSYKTIKFQQGKGNWAVDKYYKWPYSFFYQYKLKMILSMMKEKNKYYNILDFGAGPGIFTKELRWRSNNPIRSVNRIDELNKNWKFELIVCASVLEFFTDIDHVILKLKSMLFANGQIIIASPMETPITKVYFALVDKKTTRRSHKDIFSAVKRNLAIQNYKEWLGLYFCLKASLK